MENKKTFREIIRERVANREINKKKFEKLKAAIEEGRFPFRRIKDKK